MIIHVANFSTKIPGKKIAISNSKPKKSNVPLLKELWPVAAKIIVPPWYLVDAFKGGKINWEQYKNVYLQQLAAFDVRRVLCDLGKKLNIEELVLCCWESETDEHCHRKLLYDTLPTSLKGQRL